KVSLPSAVDNVEIRVRATPCPVAKPSFDLKIDGVSVGSSQVTNRQWTSFTYTKDIQQGLHNVDIAASTPAAKYCSSALFVDIVTFYGPTVPTPPPTVTLTSTPGIIPAAQSSVLTWATTNASACT